MWDVYLFELCPCVRCACAIEDKMKSNAKTYHKMVVKEWDLCRFGIGYCVCTISVKTISVDVNDVKGHICISRYCALRTISPKQCDRTDSLTGGYQIDNKLSCNRSDLIMSASAAMNYVKRLPLPRGRRQLPIAYEYQRASLTRSNEWIGSLGQVLAPAQIRILCSWRHIR